MERHQKAQGWTQAAATKRLGIAKPRVLRLAVAYAVVWPPASIFRVSAEWLSVLQGSGEK